MSAPVSAPASAPFFTVVPPAPSPSPNAVSPANEGFAEPQRPGAPEAPAARIKRLQAEARGLAREHIGVLIVKIEETAALAREIADGGDAYPVGAREIARRLCDELPRSANNLGALAARA